jgi:hypothetical protein
MGLVTVMMNVVLGIVAAVKRMLCFLHLTRRRKNSGSILPLHTDVKVLSNVDEIQTSLPSNNVELESWDSWGSEDRGDFGRRAGLESVSNGNPRYGSRFPVKKSAEPELEPDVDYFQELQLEPAIKRTKKIVVRRKEDSSYSGISSRLAMSSDLPSTGNELGTLEDVDINAGWSNEATEDLSSEAEMALREKRRLERERRLAEHQLKKHEKEVSKVLPKKDRMAAVKMS